ncbi:MAG: hypothetical protein A3A10_00840 [Candidatus Tagabacteria bacterium RIFCSPLOWO2_01_FULL_42_9]|uniref:CBS domain-containing protein n=1 Tax=Candidatus Tagabacteria bacterium RIFCSPLOWO2_01_FULL_42_9 TaxID=1802296 RepID=A0A1G2LX71_9BACT|nr:MAG: hypothetical protein A3A10_00840 [Candidatus Tagabacteria bacterium RIFCSPLOWO2_01_FULL_42_9]
MNKKNSLKNSNFIIGKNSLLEEAMRVITINHRGAVIVIDNRQRVIGVVGDGDIRRALLKGAIMSTPVINIMNPEVKKITLKDKEIFSSPKKFFGENRGINILPVVDKENKLIDLLVWESS